MVLVETIILGLEIILVTKSNVLELIIMKILHLKILYGRALRVCSRSPIIYFTYYSIKKRFQ